LLAIFPILYAIAIGFRFLTSRFLESILTQQISVRHLGVWRSNPLRWHAPAGAVGMFLIWFVAALGEHRDSEDLNGEDFSNFSGKRLFSSRTLTLVFIFPGCRHRATK